MATFFLDTHSVYRMSVGASDLIEAAHIAILGAKVSLYLSVVTAFEYSDLVIRGRLPCAPSLSELLEGFPITLLDYPSAAERLAPLLPMVRPDPVDRMLDAHAIAADLTIISGDTNMPKYPVRTLW